MHRHQKWPVSIMHRHRPVIHRPHPSPRAGHTVCLSVYLARPIDGVARSPERRREWIRLGGLGLELGKC